MEQGSQAKPTGDKDNCPRSREECLAARNGEVEVSGEKAGRVTGNDVELMPDELAFEPVAATARLNDSNVTHSLQSSRKECFGLRNVPTNALVLDRLLMGTLGVACSTATHAP